MRHILFELPTPWITIPIMGYGLMIVLGFVSGISLGYWRAKRCGENPEHVMNLGLLALIGGIGGARLFYVLGNMDQFTGHGFIGGLIAIINVRAGGLVFYGGMIVATLLIVLYVHKKKLAGRRLLDIIAPSLMLGLAFGRAGCTLNGCCWGGRCTLFEEEAKERAAAVANYEPVPPTSWAEKLMTGPLLTFPYASPAYEQQARELPWEVINREGLTVGYVVPHLSDGQVLHVPYVPGGDKDPSRQPHIRVPVEFLRPVAMAPLDVAYRPWLVRDAHGREVYYAVEKFTHEKNELVRHVVEATTQPDKTAIDLPPGCVIDDVNVGGMNVNLSFRDREDIRTPADRQLAAEARSLQVYPAQLYGIFNGLLLCIVLTIFFRRRRWEGQVFALMIILYPISRFLLEAVRKDTDPVMLEMTLSQAISLFVFIAGVVLWFALYHLPRVSPVPLSGEPVEVKRR